MNSCDPCPPGADIVVEKADHGKLNPVKIWSLRKALVGVGECLDSAVSELRFDNSEKMNSAPKGEACTYSETQNIP